MDVLDVSAGCLLTRECIPFELFLGHEYGLLQSVLNKFVCKAPRGCLRNCEELKASKGDIHKKVKASQDGVHEKLTAVQHA